MKRLLSILAIAMLMVIAFTSCNKDDDGDSNAKSYLLKSVSFYADWAGGTEKWEFTYDANKKVTQFVDYWEGAVDKTVSYDYATAGKLKLMKDGAVWKEWDINASGYVTKDESGNTFEYDANGYLIKYYENWGGADHLKYEMTITNGNITRITTYDDDGVTVKKIKEFTYTVGKNLNGLHQTNATDSDWRPVGNFFGKPSKNLVDYFEYWDPRVTPISKARSSLTYTFNALNNPIKVVKTLADMSTETWDYTFYEE